MFFDSVRDLTRATAAGIARATATRGDWLKVTLGAGRTGLLDLSSPRAAHWARIVEDLRRDSKAVYVEIDGANAVIVNLRVLMRYRMERIDPDAHGDLRVRLRP